MVKTISAAIICSLLISTAALYLYDRLFAPEIAVIDIEAYLNTQKAVFLKGEIDEAELEARLKGVGLKIAELSRRKVILVKEAVVAGGKDITDKLAKTVP